MIDRRRLMLSVAGAGVVAALPAHAQSNATDARLDALLDRWFDEDIERSPTRATNLGLDRGDKAYLSSRLDDYSLEGEMADRARALTRAATMRDISAEGLSEAGRLSRDIAAFRAETDEMGAGLPQGGGRSPYVVTQLSGAYFSVPDFMDNQHRVEDAAGADAFLARLSQFGPALDDETERVKVSAARGIVPPDFILDLTIGQLETLAATPSGDMAMIGSLERKSAAAGLSGYGARGAVLVDAEVKPALGRQIEALKALRGGAVHDAGVWRLPQGEAIYALGLRANTTTTLSADEIHRLGLEQVAQITAEIDAILKAQGMTQGTVGQRVQALNDDPAQLWPDDDAGKAALIESLNRQVAALDPLLPRLFGRLPRSRVEVRRVPPSIQDGAPGGYYQGPPLDGSRPGAYYINLRSTRNWPKFALPTLTYHEASPGHHLQVALQRESGGLPAWRRATGFSAFNEGWALYAESVAADDLDVYAGDPLGRVGFLMSYLFRAVRLVVDTGLHHHRWSREQAVDYMASSGAKPGDAAGSEINRYCVWPGQACAYKVGHTVIARLRQEAESQPGFDLRAFHDRVLEGGSTPLAVLEARMRRPA
ncbi:Tat pathway signal protein [Brevundimonas sp. Leaf363]|uniref:DUF885 domain-containing protein n=1 Tax=Brevundimonas sp. Leaf363 TaxID=1736353 RepID=UPI0006F4876F|nr:DUF885 family protein [Brevundimonas sp. Leaf363]KQS57445.1 Tat pathway signal protein [Brevundimonas sp. Leaf363]